MAFSRRRKILLLVLGLLLIAVVSFLKIRGMLQRGEPVFWVAELWAPAAFLSLGLVTCLEFLVQADPPRVDAPGIRKGSRRRR